MMSKDFEKRLKKRLSKIVDYFGTPFHIYDEKGIWNNGLKLKRAFRDVKGFKEFFAVKANPNFFIMKLMQHLGFGFDCSSIPELRMARMIGAKGEDIMFTSNNTSLEELKEALADGGCILNLDDITILKSIKKLPELICFRYNPGEQRVGNEILSDPIEAKYGIRDDQIVEAYRIAKAKGAKRFGLHTMICSNQLDYNYMAETIRMLLKVVERVSDKLGITFEFINMGGGIGIPYHPNDFPFDIPSLAREAEIDLQEFKARYEYVPALFMESGRYMTGPYGVLATKVINRMSKHREYVGLDACMSSLMRPAIYKDKVYHHITIFDKNGRAKKSRTEIVDVVGSLCENNDKFAIQRDLSKTKKGDIALIQDAGAHGYAMGFNYNGRLRPKELLLRTDGSVELIRREETFNDYIATQCGFKPLILKGR